MSARAHSDFVARLMTAARALQRGHGQRRRAFDFGVALRNPQTGQFNSGQPLPSPRAMQDAYQPSANRRAVTAAGIPSDLRTIAAAAGTSPVKSHPPLLGRAAKAESTNIAETIKRFLISRASKGARP